MKTKGMKTKYLLTLRDIFFLGAILFSVAGTYNNVSSNLERIERLEIKSSKYVDEIGESNVFIVKEIGKVKVLILETKAEILREINKIRKK